LTPLKFCGDIWHQKTRRIALSCGIKMRVTDGQIDRWTDRITTPKTASIAASRDQFKTYKHLFNGLFSRGKPT